MLLSKAVERPLAEHPGFLLVEYMRYEAAVFAVNERFDRGFPEERLRRPFEREMRFYEFRRDDRTLATTWVILRGERFVDEVGLGFPLHSRSPWVRDVFVDPKFRGQGLFAVLLDLVLAGMPERELLWSDVERSNQPSLRAHASYGYRMVARYAVIHLLGKLLLRVRWPDDLETCSSHQPTRKLLLTGKDYHSFITNGMA